MTVALDVLTSVLSETEGSRPSPTAFSGHPGRHNVATETRGRRPRSLHDRQILSPEPSTSRYDAGMLVTAATPARPAGACSRRLPDHLTDVEALTAFHTAKVVAAILLATVTR